MSAQRAFPTPAHLSPSAVPLPSAQRRRRPWRLLVFAFVFFAIAFLASMAVLLYSPLVLEGMSAIFLKPQATAIPWNGRDRITVVAMGLTQRTTEPARTDTLLAMDINPSSHQINMLSVPRDLWVNIPGATPGKLAIAYAIGGSRLAAYTLERELGIPVDYTIALTFRGFTKIVDAMGGVTVNVPQELKDSTYPCLTGYDYCPIDIRAGSQHMDGATALEFVRERHAFAQQDLARVKDQQAFTDALKHTLISPMTWPRYPNMLSTLKDSLITNVPYNALPAIGAQYVVPGTRVNHSYINIENGMVKPAWSSDGQSILKPTVATSIPNLVHQLFSDQTVAGENAPVLVLNGTSTSGEAADIEGTLQGLGFHVISSGNADNSNYKQSQVILNTSVPGPGEYTARRLQRLLAASLVREPVSGQSARIEVIVGSDFAGG